MENKFHLPKKLFTQSDFNKWLMYQCIPYIDLSLIAKMQQKKITYHRMASLIFPDEYEVDRVERTRKVTSKTASWIIDNDIGVALHKQAITEAAQNYTE